MTLCTNCATPYSDHDSHDTTLCPHCEESRHECEHCAVEYFMNCEHDRDDLCPECYDDRFECSWCGEYHYRSEQHQSRSSLCDNCEDSTDTCYSCGERTNCEDMLSYDGSMYCEQCYNNIDDDYYEGITVHDYGYKPVVEFHSVQDNKHTRNYDKTLYFGVEIEVLGSKNDLYDIQNHTPPYQALGCFTKLDGSVDYEIVTSPCDYHFHHRYAPQLLNALDRAGFESFDSGEGKAGGHIHMSRNAFNNKDHQRFFIEAMYLLAPYVHCISKRKEHTSYCEWYPSYYPNSDLKWWGDYTDRNRSNRRLAINNNNDRTIELRFPRGNMHPGRYMAYIQFATVMFLVSSRIERKYRKGYHSYDALLSDIIKEEDILTLARRLKFHEYLQLHEDSKRQSDWVSILTTLSTKHQADANTTAQTTDEDHMAQAQQRQQPRVPQDTCKGCTRVPSPYTNDTNDTNDTNEEEVIA